MKSLLKEMKEKFLEIESGFCDACDRPVDKCVCDEDEIDEQNVSAAVAGFNTPAAFAAPGKWKNKKLGYATGVKESVNTPPVFKWKETGHQQPESDEETSQDKFPFSSNLEKWPMKDQEYPVKFSNQPYGTANIQDTTKKVSLKVEDIIERKYEQLIDEGYRDFKRGDVKPSHKVKDSIREIAKKLQEIETIVGHTTRLKTESGVAATEYGPAATKALTKISERLTKIAERVRALGE